MSRGKRGTSNYKMYTFRISLENLKYIEWYSKNTGMTKGQAINNIIDSDRDQKTRYDDEIPDDPRQLKLDFE